MDINTLGALLPAGTLVIDPDILAGYRQDRALDPEAGTALALVRRRFEATFDATTSAQPDSFLVAYEPSAADPSGGRVLACAGITVGRDRPFFCEQYLPGPAEQVVSGREKLRGPAHPAQELAPQARILARSVAPITESSPHHQHQPANGPGGLVVKRRRLCNDPDHPGCQRVQQVERARLPRRTLRPCGTRSREVRSARRSVGVGTGFDDPSVFDGDNHNTLFGLAIALGRLASSHQFAVLELAGDGPGDLVALAELTAPSIVVVVGAFAEGHFDDQSCAIGGQQAKRAGIHWMVPGAQGADGLRATYLSDRWEEIETLAAAT